MILRLQHDAASVQRIAFDYRLHSASSEGDLSRRLLELDKGLVSDAAGKTISAW